MSQQPPQSPPPTGEIYGVNLQQLYAALHVIAPLIGGILITHGVMNATQFDSLINQIGTIVTDVSVLIGAVLPVWAMVSAMIKHTNASVVAEASQVPGVTVQVNSNAPDTVKAVAKDPTMPNVVEAPPK
jgi:fucose permease